MASPARQAPAQRELRHKLEGYHGDATAGAVQAVWPHLADKDRAIRYAARVALEWQDPSQWQQAALSEPIRARRSRPWWRWRASAAGISRIASRPTRRQIQPCGAGCWPRLDAIDWSRLSFVGSRRPAAGILACVSAAGPAGC